MAAMIEVAIERTIPNETAAADDFTRFETKITMAKKNKVITTSMTWWKRNGCQSISVPVVPFSVWKIKRPANVPKTAEANTITYSITIITIFEIKIWSREY